MPEWLSELSGYVGFVSIILAAVITYRNWKKSSPIEEVKKEINDKWDKFYHSKWDDTIERLDKVEEIVKHVDSDKTNKKFVEIDAKLDSDNKKIKAITEATQNQQRFLILLLKSQQQALIHLSEGNHAAALKDISHEIQEFLIKEATKSINYLII